MGQSGTIVEASSQVQVLTQPLQSLTEVESVEDDQIKKEATIKDYLQSKLEDSTRENQSKLVELQTQLRTIEEEANLKESTMQNFMRKSMTLEDELSNLKAGEESI